MADFLGSARRQAEQILAYAGAPGTATLVDLASGRVELSAGGSVEPTVHAAAARLIRNADSMVLGVGERMLVGRVGLNHAVVVQFDELPLSGATCVARIRKACDLLSRMVRPRT